MNRSFLFLLLAASVIAGGVAHAADLAGPRADFAVEPEAEILAEVEGLYLRSGCPHRKDCLPPRVFPVPGNRFVDLVTIGVPVRK